MKVRSLLVFGVGYLVGTRAGRERWEQITAFRGRLADLLEDQASGGSDSDDHESSWKSNGKTASQASR
jgi:hypothetical protein